MGTHHINHSLYLTRHVSLTIQTASCLSFVVVIDVVVVVALTCFCHNHSPQPTWMGPGYLTSPSLYGSAPRIFRLEGLRPSQVFKFPALSDFKVRCVCIWGCSLAMAGHPDALEIDINSHSMSQGQHFWALMCRHPPLQFSSSTDI